MTNTVFKNVKISGITVVLPENKISVDDELEFYKNDIKLLERNKKILGIKYRYIVENGVTCTDLCEKAAKLLFRNLNINKSEIDSLIFVSTSHDYSAPASACLLHGRLGLEETCACFDTSGLSCSGYVYGLWLAHSLISSGASKKCLLLAGDTNSLHSDKRNRISNMLYSDAGSATLIEYTKEENTSYFNLGTSGKDWNKIIIPASGYRLPVRKDIADIEITDENGNVWHLYDEILKGMDIFRFTMENAPKSIKELLTFSKKTFDDIDRVLMHQANGQILKTIAQHAAIPKEKTSAETFSKYANCGAASVVSAICDQMHNSCANNAMLVTFGVGLSWASAIINLKKCLITDIHFFKCNKKAISRQEQIEEWIKYFKGEEPVKI